MPASDPNQRALGAVYLAAISSEYSVYYGGFTAGGVIPTDVQAPTGLYVASVQGNVATLRWNPPLLGPAPDSYVLEGGVSAGQTMVAVPTGPAPFFTISAPNGSFYIRMRSSRGGARGASRATGTRFLSLRPSFAWCGGASGSRTRRRGSRVR